MPVRINNDDERPTKPYVVDFSKVVDPREEAEEYKLKSGIRPTKKYRWAWYGWLPIGTVAIVGGFEETHKTTWALSIGAKVTRGTLKGEWHEQPKNIMYIGNEDDWEATIIPRFMASGGDRERIFSIDQERADIVNGVPRLEKTLRRRNISFVIIDPVEAVLRGNYMGDEDAMIDALSPFLAMCKRLKIVAIFIKHFTKLDSADPRKLLAGSRAWSTVCRVLIIFAIAPEDVCTERGRKVVIVGVDKNNIMIKPEARAYSIGRETLVIEGDEEMFPVMVDEGHSTLTPRQALEMNLAAERQRLKGSPKADKRLSTGDWLLQYLRDHGAVKRGHIVAGGIAEGYSESALDRAWRNLVANKLGKRWERRDGKEAIWSLK